MEKDNVYVLFEEIKNKIEMINGSWNRRPEHQLADRQKK